MVLRRSFTSFLPEQVIVDESARVNSRNSSMVTQTMGKIIFLSSSEVFFETLEKREVPKETASVDLSLSNEGQKD